MNSTERKSIAKVYLFFGLEGVHSGPMSYNPPSSSRTFGRQHRGTINAIMVVKTVEARALRLLRFSKFPVEGLAPRLLVLMKPIVQFRCCKYGNVKDA
jgi:hypothetical protein